MSGTAIIYSDVYLEHDTGAHPECAGRFVAIREHLVKTGMWESACVVEPRAASVEELLTVHTRDYVESIRRLSTEGRRYLDPDTVVCERSFEVALAAVGGVFVGVDRVMRGDVRNAFCMVRPPGHHASADRAMGFCLFNNVALGARYAQRHHSLGKILIVDFDVHHGNGTQSIFYDDASVYYFSIHRWPFYPGTGAADETGRDGGVGFNRNVPVPYDLPRAEVVSLFVKTLDEIGSAFEPEFILISAGFDAHEDDPIAGLGLAPEDFREMTAAVARLAQRTCRGRLVSTLEGGYDLASLGPCVEEHLRAMMVE